MKKSSLVKKIFWSVLILVIVLLIVVGITAYQGLQVKKVVETEMEKIQTSSNLLKEQKDCTQIENIENSVDIIVSSVSKACKNPILKKVIYEVDEIPVKCENLSEAKSDFENKFVEAKEYCSNPDKFNEMIVNGSLSQEELLALAEKYGVKI